MKIICAGRNYAEHAAELQNAAPTEEPVLFIKPQTALLHIDVASIPAFTTDLHYECEVVLHIGARLKEATPDQALAAVDRVTLGIDFTARDVQSRLKRGGLSWELAKAFDGSAAVGEWRNVERASRLSELRFSLQKNGATVQRGFTGDMIFPPATLLSFASRYFTLEPGDLFFTGTPAGVGPVAAGDSLEAFLASESLLRLHIQ